MTEDEAIRQLQENNSRLVDDITDPLYKAQYDNLQAVREHIHRYVLLALGILGFTIPAMIDHLNVIPNPSFLLCGMVALAINVIYGMWYLTSKLQKDNNELAEKRQKYNGLLTARTIALDRMIRNRTPEARMAYEIAGNQLLSETGFQELIDKETGKIKAPSKKHKDYTLDIVSWLFTLAVIFYVMSFIPNYFFVGFVHLFGK